MNIRSLLTIALGLAILAGGAFAAEGDDKLKKPRPKKKAVKKVNNPNRRRLQMVAPNLGIGRSSSSKKVAPKRTAPKMPIPIPDMLPGGAMRKLKAAIRSETYPYSGASEITVYTYADSRTAKKDLAGFTAQARLSKVTAKENEVLSKFEGARHVIGKALHLYFRINIHVIEVKLNAGDVLPETAFKACVKIIQAELKRQSDLFSTIELSYKTFRDALINSSTRELRNCFPSRYLAEHTGFIDEFQSLVQSTGGMRSPRGRSSSSKTKLIRTETEGTAGWALVKSSTSSRYRYIPTWLWALEGSSTSRYRPGAGGEKTYWIPYILEDGSWRIDIANIRRNGLLVRDIAENVVMVVTLLRAVALAQEEIRLRTEDTTSVGSYAGTFEEIVKQGLISGTLAERESLGYRFQFKGSEDGKSWSMNANPRVATEDDPNPMYFYIDQSGITRFAKDKAATPKSPEYKLKSKGTHKTSPRNPARPRSPIGRPKRIPPKLIKRGVLRLRIGPVPAPQGQ